MLFLPLTFVVALVLVGLRVLTSSKVRPWDTLGQIYLRMNQRLAALSAKKMQFKQQSVGGSPQAPKNGLKPGILKQVHFAEVIATSSTECQAEQNNTHLSTPSTRAAGKDGNKSKSYKSNCSKSGNAKKDNSIPQIEEFDIDSLIEVTQNYSVISKANLIKKQQQQHLQNKTLGRKRHNSEGSKISYSSEQLFKMIAASCLSKEEVEMAVETLLNKVESGETQWKQPKNDPLLKLKNQLRQNEAALTTEAHNHEQARMRLAELKSQLKSETNSKLQAVEEVTSLRKELSVLNVAFEKSLNDLSHQRLAQKKAEDERVQIIEQLEQENGQLKSLLASNPSNDEVQRLRHELEHKLEQVSRFEIANETLNQDKHDLEAGLKNAEIHLNELEIKRRSGDYEACARIADLEADRGALEKALKDHMSRLNEVVVANSILEQSLNDARVLNNQQDDRIRRLEEKKRLDEASMQRTLREMEAELRMLHEQLSSKATTNDERHRKELNHFEKELNDAGQREQRLTDKMKQLRDGLAELFPHLKANLVHTNSDDWVHQYLKALKQLTATVEELRRRNNNNLDVEKNHNSNEHSNQSTPSKRSSLNLHANSKSSRVGSPTSNGRSSRASSNHDRDKRTMEKRLAEIEGNKLYIYYPDQSS